MTPFITDQDFTLYVGDVRDVLRELPDESVHCVVTSPPYWGLRDYSVNGQLGLEPTPDEYVENMVGVFREVKRVLRRDGTCWLNIGDSYASGPRGNADDDWTTSGLHGAQTSARYRDTLAAGTAQTRDKTKVPGLKPKDLCGIPWRLAFALQQDGWYLRSEIIWAKPNPMPESVTDRPTKSHEQVFLLTRSPRYFYDADAVREPAEWARWGDQTYSPEAEAMYGQRIKPRPKADLTPRNDGDRWNEANGRGFVPNQSGRNLRSVWQIATEAYPDAHFATFPQALVEPCVKAGTSEHGCCPVCGAPWERETTVDYENPGNRTTNGPRSVEARDDPRRATVNSRGSRLERRVETTGWRPTCYHGDVADFDKTTPVVPRPVPCTVLDPFMGSGTVAVVARRLGRRALGIELSLEYARLAARRTQQLPLLAEVTA